MSTRSEQARTNGALSRGPVTPEGKARSARNLLKHGAYAKFPSGATHTALLSFEDPKAFQETLDRRILEFAPRSSYELDLIRELCELDRKLRRYHLVEARTIDHYATLDTDERRRVNKFLKDDCSFDAGRSSRRP